MAFVYKIVLLTLLVTLVAGQSSTRSSTKRKSTSANRNSLTTPDEETRTLGLLGPLLRIGLGGLRRRPLLSSATQSDTGAGVQSDPAYGGGYGNYGGYNGYGGYGGYGGYNSNPYGGYSGYANYGQYGFPGVGYGGGYRPPTTAYPQYNSYPASYPQQNTAGLSALSGLLSSANTANAGYPGASSLGAGADPNAQQAQLAALLGQALGSSLRPIIAGGAGGTNRYSASPAAAAVAGTQSSNPLAGLLSLFG